jgi:hypothetical protein
VVLDLRPGGVAGHPHRTVFVALHHLARLGPEDLGLGTPGHRDRPTQPWNLAKRLHRLDLPRSGLDQLLKLRELVWYELNELLHLLELLQLLLLEIFQLLQLQRQHLQQLNGLLERLRAVRIPERGHRCEAPERLTIQLLQRLTIQLLQRKWIDVQPLCSVRRDTPRTRWRGMRERRACSERSGHVTSSATRLFIFEFSRVLDV